MTTMQTIKDSAKMKDKMLTLRKIKRSASQHTSQLYFTTFNFAQTHNDIHKQFNSK
jgi:hypothetical protein